MALSLAGRGLGQVWPNPAVGCIIVKNGRVIGRGWTQPGGRPHAETIALAQAGDRANSATVYVTLEPCSHHGKTPPCADALIAAGVKRVVVAMEDPDPRVSGGGLRRLRDAGIDVGLGICMDEAEALNLGYVLNRTIGRPKLTLKLAASLDGRIATKTGESSWISGSAARERVHLLRATHDAIMIGAGTARMDDPSLDVRIAGLQDRNPVRIVTDGNLSISLTSKLVQNAGQQALWVAHRSNGDQGREKAFRQAGVNLIEVPSDPGGLLQLSDLMQQLSANGITRVLCEGGGGLAASLLNADLVDEIVIFHAGMILGADAYDMLAAMGIELLSDAPRFTLVSADQIGGDIMSVWRT